MKMRLHLLCMVGIAAIAACGGTAPPGDLVPKGGPGMDFPGIRNSPSICDASFTSPFACDAEGTAFGGLFRDGRAASLVEQAKLPFLDAREIANATSADIVAFLKTLDDGYN
jgi:cytochrome c peroxidase